LAQLWGLQICRGHVLVACEIPRFDVRQLGRDHRPLARIEMPAAQVLRDDEAEDGRIIAGESALDAWGTCLQTGAHAVTPVEDATLVIYPDRLTQALRSDVGNERGEVVALHQREQVSRRAAPYR
jgi:hypothetical protein